MILKATDANWTSSARTCLAMGMEDAAPSFAENALLPLSLEVARGSGHPATTASASLMPPTRGGNGPRPQQQAPAGREGAEGRAAQGSEVRVAQASRPLGEWGAAVLAGGPSPSTSSSSSASAGLRCTQTGHHPVHATSRGSRWIALSHGSAAVPWARGSASGHRCLPHLRQYL